MLKNYCLENDAKLNHASIFIVIKNGFFKLDPSQCDIKLRYKNCFHNENDYLEN